MIQRSHGKRLTLLLIFPCSGTTSRAPYVIMVSRHGLIASQAPPMRMLVKYRGIRRIAQRATVPSALEGQGKRRKKHPHFFNRCAPRRLSPTTAWVEHPTTARTETLVSYNHFWDVWGLCGWFTQQAGAGAVLGLHNITSLLLFAYLFNILFLKLR